MAKLNLMKLSNLIPGLGTHEEAPAKPIEVEWQLRPSVRACLLWDKRLNFDDGGVCDRRPR